MWLMFRRADRLWASACLGRGARGSLGEDILLRGDEGRETASKYIEDADDEDEDDEVEDEAVNAGQGFDLMSG